MRNTPGYAEPVTLRIRHKPWGDYKNVGTAAPVKPSTARQELVWVPSHWNVLQASIVPWLMPRLNHSVRCADDPCVNDSGRTCPVISCCKRSSPTAEAAPIALSTSPASSRFRCCVLFAQIPAKQSACNSIRTDN